VLAVAASLVTSLAFFQLALYCDEAAIRCPHRSQVRIEAGMALAAAICAWLAHVWFREGFARHARAAVALAVTLDLAWAASIIHSGWTLS
jgi:hypothetical protein